MGEELDSRPPGLSSYRHSGRQPHGAACQRLVVAARSHPPPGLYYATDYDNRCSSKARSAGSEAQAPGQTNPQGLKHMQQIVQDSTKSAFIQAVVAGLADNPRLGIGRAHPSTPVTSL